MKAFAGITATAIFCLSFGFSVSQNLDASSKLAPLSDSEMRHYTAGLWAAELTTEESGEFASCSVDDCDSKTRKYYHQRYECVPCRPRRAARISIWNYKEETSWCLEGYDDDGELISCEYDWAVTDTHKTCIWRVGDCPTDT